MTTPWYRGIESGPGRYRAYEEVPPPALLWGEDQMNLPGGNVVHRDRSGRLIGTSSGNSDARTDRDSNGRITGSATTSPSGTTTHRDSSGTITISSSTSQGSGGDATTTYRRAGSIVGTKYVSQSGNVTWRDGNGRILSGPNW